MVRSVARLLVAKFLFHVGVGAIRQCEQALLPWGEGADQGGPRESVAGLVQPVDRLGLPG